MREILFRGKRVDNNEWVFGSFIHNSIDAHCIVYYDAEKFEVIPETIGQFTGLLDKNGKKIFEGDKVKFKWGNKIREEVIEFRIFSFTVGLSLNFLLHEISELYLEVIGNIHE